MLRSGNNRTGNEPIRQVVNKQFNPHNYGKYGRNFAHISFNKEGEKALLASKANSLLSLVGMAAKSMKIRPKLHETRVSL